MPGLERSTMSKLQWPSWKTDPGISLSKFISSFGTVQFHIFVRLPGVFSVLFWLHHPFSSNKLRVSAVLISELQAWVPMHSCRACPSKPAEKEGMNPKNHIQLRGFTPETLRKGVIPYNALWSTEMVSPPLFLRCKKTSKKAPPWFERTR